MHAWESIRKTVDYIEENLSQKMTPETLAKIAALSPFYFQRLFTRLLNRPVNDYVKMRRLARACEVLAEKKSRILDIALDCGFNSHESLTKAFKSAYGVTPEDYRKKPVPLNQVMKPDLLLNYVMVDENVPLIADGMVLEITRKNLTAPENYIGVSDEISIAQNTPAGEATGINAPYLIWEQFYALENTIQSLLPDGIKLGASMMGDAENGTFTYFAGAAADAGATADGELTAWELPAGEYVVCCFEAENMEELRFSALDKAMKYLLSTWLANHKLMIQPFSAEKYTGEACMEIWVLPIPTER